MGTYSRPGISRFREKLIGDLAEAEPPDSERRQVTKSARPHEMRETQLLLRFLAPVRTHPFDETLEVPRLAIMEEATDPAVGRARGHTPRPWPRHTVASDAIERRPHDGADKAGHQGVGRQPAQIPHVMVAQATFRGDRLVESGLLRESPLKLSQGAELIILHLLADPTPRPQRWQFQVRRSHLSS
jgi:hypothetical protein